MKKLALILALIMLLLCSCNREGSGTGEAETTHADGVTYEYSEDGSQKTAAVTYKDGIEISRDSYEYDENGNIVLVKTIQNGTTVQTLENTYVDKMLTKTSKEFVDEDVVCKEVTNYNEEGYVVSTKYYEDGKWTGCELYHYDDNKNMVKSENVDEDGNVLTHKEYQYNQAGRIIRADYYEFGSLTFYYTYEYDADGSLAEINQFDSNGNPIGK